MVKTTFVSAIVELTPEEAVWAPAEKPLAQTPEETAEALHKTLDLLSIKLTGHVGRLVDDENFSFAPHPSQPSMFIVAGNVLEVA